MLPLIVLGKISKQTQTINCQLKITRHSDLILLKLLILFKGFINFQVGSKDILKILQVT